MSVVLSKTTPFSFEVSVEAALSADDVFFVDAATAAAVSFVLSAFLVSTLLYVFIDDEIASKLIINLFSAHIFCV